MTKLPVFKKLRVIGMMSGTSLDGVDVCLADIEIKHQLQFKIQAALTVPFSPSLKQQIFQNIHPVSSRLNRLCQLNMELGHFFADAALKMLTHFSIAPEQVDLIGSHGQTFYHIPPGKAGIASTLQMGEPAVIATKTGITTVADFRPADMAVGGQGAPLIPFFDYLLFRDSDRAIALQNIGGIANVTYLPPKAKPNQVLAFDTGPGNMVLDRLIFLATEGQQWYDDQGQMAAKGMVDQTLLTHWLSHPYFKTPPPKSTGREEFGFSYADRLYREAHRKGLSEEDIMATVTSLTAHSIYHSYRDYLPQMPTLTEVIVGGGGIHNQTLLKELQLLFKSIPVVSSEKYQIPPDMKEALAFACLAYTTWYGLANNLPSVTGADREIVLGKIVPGLNYRHLLNATVML